MWGGPENLHLRDAGRLENYLLRMNGKRRLYVETDDSCAMCGSRQKLTIHHIDGDSSNNVYDNQIVLCWSCHESHQDNNVPSEEDIRSRKETLIVRTLTQYGISALKYADRNEGGTVALPFLVHHLVELGYLDEQEMQMGYGTPSGNVDVTKRYTITGEGKRILTTWRGL